MKQTTYTMLILPLLPIRFSGTGMPEFIEVSASWILRLKTKIVEKHIKT